MVSIPRAYLHTLLTAILMAALCGSAQAIPPNTIKEVTVTPDLRRVVVKCSGQVGQFNTFRLDRPPRLVVDIAGARPDRNLKTDRPAQNGGLKVQVAESRTGAHVVLDFGGASVPELRVRRIGSYLIVFMDAWKPLKQSASQVKPERRHKPKPVFRRQRPVAEPRPEQRVPRSDLAIKSARVIDGLIVLTVSDRQHPEQLYRIDLGVNFKQMGFVSAGIYPLQAQPGEPLRVTTKDGVGRKIGPRREAPPGAVRRGPGKMVSLRGSRKAGLRSGRATYGPRRSPQAAPARGPVSLHLKSVPRAGGWVEKTFPHCSVVEEARAKLFAYRRAPLVHSQPCVFTPRKNKRTPR